MKTRKVLALVGVTLLAAGVLAACSGGSGAQALKVKRPLRLPTKHIQIISTI